MKEIGYTTGVFDMFHIGHLNLLRRAKIECDYLIVGVSTDELCKLSKNKSPIIPFEERMEIISNIKFVDEVVPQTNYDKVQAWNNLRFNKMFVGDDWKGTDKWTALEKKLTEVEIIYFPYTSSTSSSELRKLLKKKIEKIIISNETTE